MDLDGYLNGLLHLEGLRGLPPRCATEVTQALRNALADAGLFGGHAQAQQVLGRHRSVQVLTASSNFSCFSTPKGAETSRGC